MENKKFKASLGKVEDRGTFTISFIHPKIIDKDGNIGKRIHRGLGTQNKEEAQKLVEQMNEILSNEELWHLGSKERAKAKFDERIVEMFYSEIETVKNEPCKKRDECISLPGKENGYRKVLLLGTTGAGKTTLIRQILGTDPLKERFPSTSTAKTTIADMEFILSEGDFSAVVTFTQLEQVIEYIEECAISAIQVCCKDENNIDEIMRHLLNHVDQRFRMSYILGNFKQNSENSDEEDDEEDDNGEDNAQENITDNANLLEETKSIFNKCLSLIQEFSAAMKGKKSDIEKDFSETIKSQSDKIELEEMIEEEFFKSIKEEEKFHSIVDYIKDEIRKRFAIVKEGSFKKDRQGWPEVWQYSTTDRDLFIKTLSFFTSNYSKKFGTLLTPIVSGIRVRGPFNPVGSSKIPRLVLLDGEGLGHTYETATSLSSSVVKRIDICDCILLVDNATQPMQSGSLSVLSQVASAGYQSKLFICFTHFDAVVGDNLPSRKSKQKYIFSSLENALKGIGAKQGSFLERSLKERLSVRCFYFGYIQKKLSGDDKDEKKTIEEIDKLLKTLQTPEKPLQIGEALPIYDRAQLVLRIKGAAERFHSLWDARLGNRYDREIPKEHWTRIKALSRRLAVFNIDEYDNLKPVGDLYKELVESIRCFIERPLKWEPEQPDEKVMQESYDIFAQEISKKILEFVAKRIHNDKERMWLDAYNCSGRGSSYKRADIISKDIYNQSAPILTEIPSPVGTEFRKEIEQIILEASKQIKAKLE